MQRFRIGQLFFSAMSHRLYDWFVYRLVSPYVWRCKLDTIIGSYQRNLSDRHLEIGVGTGYLLELSEPHPPHWQLALLDLNRRCGRKSAARLKKYQPAFIQQDLRVPLVSSHTEFQSIGMNFVWHCVPDGISEHQPAFTSITRLLESGGVFFGATVLNHGVPKSITARALMSVLNAVGIFHNRRDRLDELQQALEEHFDLVEIEVAGSVALWRAVKP